MNKQREAYISEAVSLLYDADAKAMDQTRVCRAIKSAYDKQLKMLEMLEMLVAQSDTAADRLAPLQIETDEATLWATCIKSEYDKQLKMLEMLVAQSDTAADRLAALRIETDEELDAFRQAADIMTVITQVPGTPMERAIRVAVAESFKADSGVMAYDRYNRKECTLPKSEYDEQHERLVSCADRAFDQAARLRLNFNSTQAGES